MIKALSFCKPQLGIHCIEDFPYQKVYHAFAGFGVVAGIADFLFGIHLVAFIDQHIIKVTVNGKEFTMTNDYSTTAAGNINDTGYFALKNTANTGTVICSDVNTIIFYSNAF